MTLSAAAVLSTLESAKAPTDVDYSIVAADGANSRVAHLAVSRRGTFALLVPLARVGGETTRLTQGVALHGASVVEFARGAERWRAPAAVIECREAGLLRTFAAMAAALVERLERTTSPSWPLVTSLFAEWERLLGRRQVLTGESELGLWGELWCLARTSRPAELLEAWRGPEAEPVDFLLDGHGFEVKAGKRAGVHVVSQSQVDQPLGDVPAFLVSLHVMPDPLRGRSLAELVEEVAAHAADTGTFEEKLASVGYSRADEQAYGRRLALLQAPTFYKAESVPRVRVADPGVSRMRYRVELSRDNALNGPELEVVASVLGLAPSTYEYPCA